jgi:hypothetical protein
MLTNEDWKSIQPKVNSEAEFFEILNDFGNPLELLREAISNSIDAHASYIKISFDVAEVGGNKRLVITMLDDGHGMTREVLEQDFWGLGYSPSRDRSDAIGEKGHGTKIYLRSEQVTVRTQSHDGAYMSECDRPLSFLSRRQLHQPRIKAVDPLWKGTGTEIKIVGYNDNERSKFVQDVVRDYLLWFTKLGSVELMFGKRQYENFIVYLKSLDVPDFEEIKFGHPYSRGKLRH